MDCLPSPELLDQEADRWKGSSGAMQSLAQPTACAVAIVHVTPELFRTCFAKDPVISCECEHNRRLSNKYMCASMEQERQSSLALLHIHYDSDIDVMKVVLRFEALHPAQNKEYDLYTLDVCFIAKVKIIVKLFKL